MKKGITFGAFDLFHAGHVLMLQEAKTVCDYLIVCIQTDPSFDRNLRTHLFSHYWREKYKSQHVDTWMKLWSMTQKQI